MNPKARQRAITLLLPGRDNSHDIGTHENHEVLPGVKAPGLQRRGQDPDQGKLSLPQGHGGAEMLGLMHRSPDAGFSPLINVLVPFLVSQEPLDFGSKAQLDEPLLREGIGIGDRRWRRRAQRAPTQTKQGMRLVSLADNWDLAFRRNQVRIPSRRSKKLLFEPKVGGSKKDGLPPPSRGGTNSAEPAIEMVMIVS